VRPFIQGDVGSSHNVDCGLASIHGTALTLTLQVNDFSRNNLETEAHSDMKAESRTIIMLLYTTALYKLGLPLLIGMPSSV